MMGRFPRLLGSFVFAGVLLVVIVGGAFGFLGEDEHGDEGVESVVVAHGWNDGPGSVNVRVGTINEMGTGKLYTPEGSQDHAEWFLKSREPSDGESELACDETTLFLYALYEGPDQREEIRSLMDPDCEGGYVVHIDPDGGIHLFEMA